MMQSFVIVAIALAGGALALTAPDAQAQTFPSHLKGCKKSREFERVTGEYTVPAVAGGAGRVQVVTRHYECRDTYNGGNSNHSLSGMKNAAGKLVVPYDYGRVLPFSTTGAVVNVKGGFRTYIAGKGEGRDLHSFQDALMLNPVGGCSGAAGDTSPGSVSAVIGETFYGISGGRSHVTLFTSDGTPRKLEYMGGDDIKPAVRRVGDVLVARWRDDQGVLRTGILDLHGRQIAPVLSSSSLWITPKQGLRRTSIDMCDTVSLDLFIEGPSLDYDPAKVFFGPLLLPVGRDGQPAALPKGAIGMFPAYPRKNTSGYTDAPPNVAAMWAVVFPRNQGFEFTLHVGTPSEALIAAESGPRYSDMARDISYGGLVAAQAVSDGKWRTYRSDTEIVVGEVSPDLDRSFDTAEAVLGGEVARKNQAEAEAWEQDRARRAEARKRHWETARAAGRLCDYRVDSENSREEVEEYIRACGPGHFPGLAQLARAKGIAETTLQLAADDEWKRATSRAQAQAEAEEAARIRRMQMANKDPGAGYVPGQWESAIRNAGNAAVDDINKSSDNWLQQRRDQYNADWQRSQRAY